VIASLQNFFTQSPKPSHWTPLWKYTKHAEIENKCKCKVLGFATPAVYFSSSQQPSKGEMRLPSSTLSTPIRRRCSHTLLSAMFKICSFVLVGESTGMLFSSWASWAAGNGWRWPAMFEHLRFCFNGFPLCCSDLILFCCTMVLLMMTGQSKVHYQTNFVMHFCNFWTTRGLHLV